MPSPFTILASIAEQKISQAEKEGAFDNLAGAGQPLVLEDESHIPEDLRMAYKILKNAGFVPPELAARKEISSILHLLENCTDAQEKVRQMRKLHCLLDKIKRQRNRPVFLEESDPYYTHILNRISVLEKKS